MNLITSMKKSPQKMTMRMVKLLTFSFVNKYRRRVRTVKLTQSAALWLIWDLIWPTKVLRNKTNRIWRIRRWRVRTLNWRWRFCLKIYLKLLNGWLHNSNAFNTEIKKWLWKTLILMYHVIRSQSVGQFHVT